MLWSDTYLQQNMWFYCSNLRKNSHKIEKSWNQKLKIYFFEKKILFGCRNGSIMSFWAINNNSRPKKMHHIDFAGSFNFFVTELLDFDGLYLWLGVSEWSKFLVTHYLHSAEIGFKHFHGLKLFRPARENFSRLFSSQSFFSIFEESPRQNHKR